MTTRPRRGVYCLTLGLLLVVSLAACGEEDSQRQFANDAPTAVPRTAVMGPTAISTTQATAAPAAASPAALLAPRGAPRRIYFIADGQLWSMASDDRQPRPFFNPKGETLRAVASSPNGDRVALLSVESKNETETATLILLAADGSELRRMPGVERSLTIPAGGRPKASSLHWSPQGDRLVATFIGGGIVSIPLDATMSPVLLVPADVPPFTSFAAWSPAGDQIAFISAPAPEAAADLWVVRTGEGAATPSASPELVVEASESGATVGALAWTPDGGSILYTQRSATGAPGTGGDLFSIAPSGSDRRVIASAGRAAPVAEVARFAPSPDGRAIAFTVFVPREDGLAFHSLWLRPIRGGQSLPLAVPNGETVTDLWWSASGLIFRAVPSAGLEGTSYTGGAWSLYRARPSGPPERLFGMDTATPAASPAGSPNDGSLPPATITPSP